MYQDSSLALRMTAFGGKAQAAWRPLIQCLFQISNQVIDIFNAYGEAEEAAGNAPGLPFFFRKIAVGLGSRIGNQAFYTAQAFSKADELYIFQDGKRRFMAVRIEGKHGTGTPGLFEMDVSAGKIG